MEPIHQGLAAARFSDTRPNSVTTATICKCSGKLATDACRNDPRGNQVYTEYYLKGTVPTETCTTHVTVDICADSGLLAGEYCPNRQTKVYITRPDTETGNWSRAADAAYMLTIKDTCSLHTAPVVPEEPEEPETPEEPEEPETPEELEEPEEPEEPTDGNNISGENNNVSGGNNTSGGNSTEGVNNIISQIRY